MKNKNGFISMTLVYTFLILFLFLMTGILTSYNQRNKYYDIIEEKIKSEMNLTSFRNNTLYNTILKDNKVVIPNGTDVLLEGDKIFTLSQTQDSIKSIMDIYR